MGETYETSIADGLKNQLAIAQSAYAVWMDNAYARYPDLVEKTWLDKAGLDKEFALWLDRKVAVLSGDEHYLNQDWTLVATPKWAVSARSLYESIEVFNAADSSDPADEDKDKDEFLAELYGRYDKSLLEDEQDGSAVQFGLISNRPLLQGDFESMHEQLAGMRNPDISVPNLLEAIMYAYVLRQKGENDEGEHVAMVHLDMQPQDMFELKVGGEFVPRTFILSTGRLCLSAASCNRDLHMTSRLIVT